MTFLRRRLSAATAAAPNSTSIGGAGIGVPLVDPLVLDEELLDELDEELLLDEDDEEDDVEVLLVMFPDVEVLVETLPEVEELVEVETLPEVDDETLPEVDVLE